MEDHLTSTAIHEAAHAAVSCALGEDFQYVELTSDRTGNTMPFHSPCRICASDVPDGIACETCMLYYEKNDPRLDEKARSINRSYRIEAAIAAAGEIAEAKFNRGVLLASEDEVESDRERVLTRSSLRHLWRDDACNNYCRYPSDCAACSEAGTALRQEVKKMLDNHAVWNGVVGLAEKLKAERRLSGADAKAVLADAGVAFGSDDIDRMWPQLP